MSVVINTFEVVADDQPQSTPRSAPTSSETQAPTARGATPHEVENILRREQERFIRLLAH